MQYAEFLLVQLRAMTEFRGTDAALAERVTSGAPGTVAISIEGEEETTDGTGQLVSRGATAEHEPLHWIVPVVCCPQMFADDVQELP